MKDPMNTFKSWPVIKPTPLEQLDYIATEVFKVIAYGILLAMSVIVSLLIFG